MPERVRRTRAPDRPPAALAQVPGERTQQVLLVRRRPARSHADTAHTVSNGGTASTGIGAATSSTSCPRPASSALACSHARAHLGIELGRRSASRRTGRCAAGRARGRTAGRNVLAGGGGRIRVAGLRDRDRVEERGRVADGAGERAEHAQPGRVDVERPSRDPAAGRSSSPTRPHTLAGMRIDPPPSLPCANGRKPLATAARRAAAGTAGQPAWCPRACAPAGRCRSRCSRAARTRASPSCRR